MEDIILRCVECGATSLISTQASLHCEKCGAFFARHSYKSIPVLVRKLSRLNIEDILQAKVDTKNIELDAAQRHWDTSKFSEQIKNVPRGLLLSYGSGDGGDRRWLESLGFTVIAIDVYPGPFTDYVCDGHDLPFADNQFDVVTSLAVFEHLYDPFRAAQEKYRVLKAGGALVGSVAFLEPFHASSYFHMSHLGLTETLTRAGFHSVELQPGWSFLESLNSNFWLWNQVPFVRSLTKPLNRQCYRFGMALWRFGYRLKGKTLPNHLPFAFAGSIQFKALK